MYRMILRENKPFLREKFKKTLELYILEKLRYDWNINIVLGLEMIFSSYINLNEKSSYTRKFISAQFQFLGIINSTNRIALQFNSKNFF